MNRNIKKYKNTQSLPLVYVVIVNWNGMRFIKNCLSSVFNNNYPNYRILVVDNGSTDGSLEWIKKDYPVVEIIENKKNMGFAEGNNIGFKYILKNKNVKYIALLNNDTKVEADWLKELVKAAENSREKIGSFDSKLLTFDGKKIDGIGISINKRGLASQIGHYEIDKGQFDEVGEIFGTIGAACLYRRELIEDIGYFDKKFFAYFEDVDLSWRAQLMGWKALYIPSSIVWHMGSATGGKNSYFKKYFIYRNKYYYLIKNAELDLLRKGSLHEIKKSKIRIMEAMRKKDFYHIFIIFKSGINVLINLPGLLIKRHKIQSNMRIEKLKV